MSGALFVTRLIHIVASIGWVGEVITVNAVLLPALARADPAFRARLLTAIFPFVFRLATALAGVAVLSGALVFLMVSGGDLTMLLEPGWGQRILVGGIIGLGLFVFHLVQESRWEGSLASRLGAVEQDAAASEAILRRLRIVPRVGLVILLVVVVLMSAAARLP